MHKEQDPKRVAHIKSSDRKKITVETVNSVANKLYEGLNPNNIISEQAGFWVDRFLNTEKIKLLKVRFGSAN